MERKNRGILKNKLFLYLTEFFSGMSVMAVELGASRLLAPYFSSSQIVWTIIIGTIMIAMALGNIYGGRTADKSPNPDKLYGRIIVAALWIALIPVVGKYIIVGISAVLIFSVNNNFLILAAFVACMVIRWEHWEHSIRSAALLVPLCRRLLRSLRLEHRSLF